ncbi:WXG100 family type VII secretion target [Rhizomonospora bruguierae]|uniref:hypothetical protein n=1 Tax=Rhizomonospora bruguierae TaxID=1581705 RepID=UPI001BCE4640|nr:hypothetical protein [Micromonospora sp. NBRC 107566]
MASGNYNWESIRIDPMQLYKLATVDLKERILDYGAQLTELSRTWETMPGSWAGSTATEVQAYFDRYNELGRDLFGTGKENLSDETPNDAVLVKMAVALARVAANFDAAEGAVIEAFSAFTQEPPDVDPKDPNLWRRSPGVGPVVVEN